MALARPKEKTFDEDVLCAKYIKGMLENSSLKNYDEEIEKLKTTSGSKFFNESSQNDFPKRDFYLCTEVNKFSFILKVKKDEKNNLYIEKIDV